MDTQYTPKVIPAIATAQVKIVKAAASEQVAPSPVRRWRARVFQIYLVGATATFGILVVLASATSYFTIDLSITRSVQTSNSVVMIHRPRYRRNQHDAPNPNY